MTRILTIVAILCPLMDASKKGMAIFGLQNLPISH
jgi:hypothetical protein